MSKFIKIIHYFILSFSVLIIFFSCSSFEKKPPNVLFIAVDDLRPELGCYGNELIKSPNLDKLSSEGRLFNNHFVQVPTCGASRYSMLTGKRPTKKIHIKNSAISETFSGKPEFDIPETFAHQMKRNGYYTVSIGKISHHPDGIVYGYNEEAKGPKELPHSWDEIHSEVGEWGNGWKAFFAYSGGKNRIDEKQQVLPYEKVDIEDSGFPDGLNADLAVRKLKELKEKNQPFLLAVGFYKPHMPWAAPQKYWDLYNEDSILISPNPEAPANIHESSLNSCGEFNNYKLGKEKAGRGIRLTDEYAKHLIHAYYACISYADAQVGKVLNELERLELDENTMIIVWGAHGWHLGDHTQWGKHTLFERSLKSALIVKIPGMQNPGITSNGIVESIDIYPTIMNFCNIEYKYELDGISLMSIMENPDSKIKDQTYGYFKKGISMRNERYRITKFYRDEMPTVELYDHQTDPLETINIAGANKSKVNELLPLLEEGNQGLFMK